jgi:hypothetical protein
MTPLAGTWLGYGVLGVAGIILIWRGWQWVNDALLIGLSPQARASLVIPSLLLIIMAAVWSYFGGLPALSPSVSDSDNANGQSRSGTWRRLTDADRTKLSLMFSDGSLHKIRIYRTPTPDCIRLADDFYKFFDRMQWMQTHRPESPHDWEIPPGIYVATIPDNVPTAKIKNIKEQSGAIALIKGMESIGLPVISDHLYRIIGVETWMT